MRLADARGLSRVVYNLGQRPVASAATWCEALLARRSGFAGAAATDEPGNVDSHTGFHRGPMAIGQIARDTGYAPHWDFAAAAREWLAWQH